MQIPGNKLNEDKINNRNFKVLPIEDYYIQYEGLKYKKKPIIDFGRMFLHLERIMRRGTKKEQAKAKQLYAEQISDFSNKYLHKVMPEDIDSAKKRADDKFYKKFPEDYYTNIPDVAHQIRKVLDISKCGESAYNEAIQEWEKDFRSGLVDDLCETWCWEDDRRRDTAFYVNHFPEITSPVTIPNWIFAANTFNERNFHALSDIEKVALAHAVWFTLNKYPTGYIEASGHVEQWCRCDVNDVHEAFQRLYNRKLLLNPMYSCPNVTTPLTRNWGWMANVVYIQQVLSNYGRVIYK